MCTSMVATTEPKMVRLPRIDISLDEMSVSAVRTLVSNLICITENRRRPGYISPSEKPKWWPKHIPYSQFTDDDKDDEQVSAMLSIVVRRCYEHYEKQYLLSAKDNMKMTRAIQRRRVRHTELDRLTTSDGTLNGDDAVQQRRVRHTELLEASDGTLSGDDAVQSPAKEKSGENWDLESKTLSAESAEVPISMLEPVPGNVSAKTSNNLGKKSKSKRTVIHDVFICFYCEQEFTSRSDHKIHQSSCTSYVSKLPTESTNFIIKRPASLNLTELNPRPATQKPKFIEALGLVATKTAASLISHRQSSQVECEIIDLTEEDHGPPKTPLTPRGSRVSILSRDLSPPGRHHPGHEGKTDDKCIRSSPRMSSRKNSFIGTIQTDPASHTVLGSINASAINQPTLASIKVEITDNELEGLDACNRDEDQDSEAESESCKSDDLDNADFQFIGKPKKVSLLNIDVSSLLGQKLIEHYKTEISDKDIQNFITYNKNYDKFCQTPRKNEAVLRLRNRPQQNSYPIQFRYKMGKKHKNVHIYRFNKAGRREFMKYMKTGLNYRSRKLKKAMPSCSVKLKKINDTDIDKLKEEVRRSHQELIKKRREQYEKDLLRSMMPYSSSHQHLFNHQASTLNQQHIQNNHAMHTKQLLYNRLMSGMGQSTSSTFPNLAAQMLKSDLSKQQGPQQRIPKSPKLIDNDEIIAISSSDEDEGDSSHPDKNKKAFNTPPPAKKPKVDSSNRNNQTVLFKCHICSAEILFNITTTDYIRKHFAKKHNVHNIQIINQSDASGNIVLSIVESSPKKNAAVRAHNSNVAKRLDYNGTRPRPGPASAQKRQLARMQERAAKSINLPSTSSQPVDDVICID